MSRVGRFLLRKLSRDPAEGDYAIPHYEVRHHDLDAMTASLIEYFPSIREGICGKRVLDVGCSEGMESVALARLGAREVDGIDIRIDFERAGEVRTALAVPARVDLHLMDALHLAFADESFDVVVTCSSFEHFLDPVGMLREAHRVLKPGGRIYLTSGNWWGPWGAHMTHFTRLPWVQFLFSEETIMAVRSDYRSDGAERFEEVEGGLNRIDIRSFRRFIDDLGLSPVWLRPVPVKGMRSLSRIPVVGTFFTHEFHAVLRKEAEVGRSLGRAFRAG